MSGALDGLVLLDSNVLIHFARNDATAQEIENTHSLTARSERPLLSSIVEGEVLALAKYSGWGTEKLKRLADLLAELVRVDAGLPEIVEAYVDLYCFARKSGKAIAQHDQNDLWIAATAQATAATLYTCDDDFNFLHPQHITVCYIPER